MHFPIETKEKCDDYFLISISKSSGLEWMDLGFLAFILKRPEGRVPFAQWSYNFLCKEGLLPFQERIKLGNQVEM